MSGLKIYVASSWRCPTQPAVVSALRAAGFEVYDFRNPPESSAFRWTDIDPWFKGTVDQDNTRAMLAHPVARKAFDVDMGALRGCDLCVLVMPCGRSAHLEAGYAVGAGKPTCILLGDDQEPELMHLMADYIAGSAEGVIGLALWIESLGGHNPHCASLYQSGRDCDCGRPGPRAEAAR